MPKNIIINPSSAIEPNITFTGNTSGNIVLKVLDDGTVTFTGTSGSLFTIKDSLVGKLQGVYNISGLPVFEVFSDPSVIVYGPLQVNTSTYTNGLYLNPINNNLNTQYSLYYDPSSKKITYGDNNFGYMGTGSINYPLITNTSTQLTVVNSSIRMYDNANYIGLIKEFNINGSTLSFTPNQTNFLIAEYNNGSPRYRITNNISEINESNIIPLSTFYYDGTSMHYLPWTNIGLGKLDKMHQRLVKTERFKREGDGLSVSVDSSRYISISAGKVWYGVNAISIPQMTSSSTNQIYFFYKNAGNWTYNRQEKLNNTYYNNGTNLITLTNNRYAINWIYVGVENDKDIYVLPGEGNYILSEALNATKPNIVPDIINFHALLVGRVIYITDSSIATDVISYTDAVLTTGGSIANHNALNNIQGGLPNEYYHINAGEYTRVQLLDASFNSKAPINNPIFTGTVTVPSNISYNMYGSSRTPFLIYGGNATGQGLAISGQGTTIIGGGSSPNTAAANIDANESSPYIVGNSRVKIITNISAGWENRKEFIFGASGTLVVPDNLTVNGKSVLSGNIGTDTQMLYNNNGVVSPIDAFRYDTSTGNIIGANTFYTDNEVTSRYNTCFGFNSGLGIRNGAGTGKYNVLNGWRAGSVLVGGSRNIFIGTLSGNNVIDGNDNIFIGHNAGDYDTSLCSNKLGIETNGTYNQNLKYLIEGDFSQRWVKVNGGFCQTLKTIAAPNSSISGTCTSTSIGRSPILMYDSSQTLTNNTLYYKLCVITDGKGKGLYSKIGSNGTNYFELLEIGETQIDTTSKYKIVSNLAMSQMDMNTSYHIDLTNGDFYFNLPDLGKGDVNVTISNNPNNNKLYLSAYATNNNCFLPFNKLTTIYTEPGIIHNIREYNKDAWQRGYVETTSGIYGNIQRFITSNSSININVTDEIYKLDVSTNTQIYFNISQLMKEILYNNCYNFELHINMSAISTITWPTNVTWVSNKAPTFSAIDNYVLVFRTIDAGANWIGNLAYSVNNTAQPSTLVANQLNIRENKAESYNSEFNLLFIPPRDISGNSSVYFTKTVNDDKLTYDSSNGILNSKKFKGDGSLLTNINISNNMISEYISYGFDGVNKQVILQNNYSNIQVYLNGLRQFLNDDYTTSSGKYITFIVAPKNGDKVICDYIKI